jgi:prophage DNA circulation protein
MLPKDAVQEAAAIVRLSTGMLLQTSDKLAGRAGSDLRRACGDLAANAEEYITYNKVAPKLAYCFDQARVTGATLPQFDQIRVALVAQAPVSLVGALLAEASIAFCLQQMALAVVSIVFTSRDDVDALRPLLTDAFKLSEESAADAMAQASYIKLIALHAAVMKFLYQTAQPLPQMLNFEFAVTQPTLVQSYRLYADAGRADELLTENKVVHPAFPPRAGRALSF